MANSLAPIAKWTIQHEQIVAMYIGGMLVGDIAKAKRMTQARISQILDDTQARRIINEAMLKVRAGMMENLDSGLAVLADKAMQQMAKTINYDEFELGGDGKKHQDRLCFDLIKLVKGDAIQTESVKPLDREMSERLLEALEDSKAASELIREADFEVVESE